MIRTDIRNVIRLVVMTFLLSGFVLLNPTAVAGGTGDKNTADIIFQSMCSGGGTNGILDADFPMKISWRCAKCGAKQEVTVDLVKNDNTDSIARKIAQAVNGAVAGSENVKVTYYQSSATNRQNQNWYRIHFEGVDQVDAGAWHSKLKLIIVNWEGVRVVAPTGTIPPNVTPARPGRTLKPGKVIDKDRKKRQWTGDEVYGWKEVNFCVGVHPWPGPGQVGAIAPWYEYRLPSYESDPDKKIFDDLQTLLINDGFEILRLGETSLAILSGPENTVVSTVLINTVSREEIEQEEHWTTGDVVSNTEEDEPVELPRRVSDWLRTAIQTEVNGVLSRIATDVANRAELVPWSDYPSMLSEDQWVFKSFVDPFGDLYGPTGAAAMGPEYQDITGATATQSGDSLTFTLDVSDEFPSLVDFNDGAVMILIDTDGDGEVKPVDGIIDFYGGNLDYGIFIPSPEFGEPPIFIEDLKLMGTGEYETDGVSYRILGHTIEITVEARRIGSPRSLRWVGAIRTGITHQPVEDRVPNIDLADP